MSAARPRKLRVFNNFCLFPRKGGVIQFPPLVVLKKEGNRRKLPAGGMLMFIILVSGNQCSYAVKETFFYSVPSSIGTISVESLPSK